MKSNKSHLYFKFRDYEQIADSDVWKDKLKPDLEKIKNREAMSDVEAENEFDALKRDIKRSQSIKIINEIIGLIEKAGKKADGFK